MNKLLLGVGAYLLWRILKLEWRVESSEEATADILADFDDTISKHISETAQHMGMLYNENHFLGHQVDLISLDYLNHLAEYKHLDGMTERPVTGQPYIVGAPDPTSLEFEMKEDGLAFETRRLKGV